MKPEDALLSLLYAETMTGIDSEGKDFQVVKMFFISHNSVFFKTHCFSHQDKYPIYRKRAPP